MSVSRNSELARNASSRMECEIVVSSSRISPFALRPAARRNFPSGVFREHIAPLAPVSFSVTSSSVSRISSSTPVVLSLRAASRKIVSFFEVGDFLRNLDAGDLADEVARRIGGDVLGMKNSVNRVAGAELQTVVAAPALCAAHVRH